MALGTLGKLFTVSSSLGVWALATKSDTFGQQNRVFLVSAVASIFLATSLSLSVSKKANQGS